MSRSRHGTPLSAYSLSPERNKVRVIVTSLNSMGSIPEELSIVRLTSARPSAARLVVPAKMTSSIFCERTAEGAWAPSTQPIASTTLDLPEPLGPTTTVTPGSRSRAVVSAKDLKPFIVSRFRYIRPDRPRSRRWTGWQPWSSRCRYDDNDDMAAFHGRTPDGGFGNRRLYRRGRRTGRRPRLSRCT
ncbi:unannotated protein [freshwater metagenome]|uniref:Unannotated protein n=1 Tax=freshwater metagenome TaxID=449393 RepID=A0A6J6IJ29_9ZZZZ